MSETAARCSLVGFFCFFAGMCAAFVAYDLSTGNYPSAAFQACLAIAHLACAIFWTKA